jgi:hypothetical protein
MSGQRDVGQRISMWLEEEAVGHLPDTILDAAIAQARTARRSPALLRRVPRVSRNVLLPTAVGVALIAVLLGAAMAGSGRPPASGASPSPDAAASGRGPSADPGVLPPLTDEFVSTWYGYRVAFPAGWTAGSGAGPWPLGQNLGHGDPHLDVIRSSAITTPARLVAASIALPPGMDMTGFRAFASPQADPCTPVAPLPKPVRIDGIDAFVSLDGCRSLAELGGNIYDVLVISGGRGYDFTLDGGLSADEALLWLATIRLEPATAPETPPIGDAPASP